MRRTGIFLSVVCLLPFYGQPSRGQAAKDARAISSDSGIHPNLAGHIGRPLRYRPEADDFVIQNGQEYFNRSLYGGNTAFRVDGGDKPEFVLYLPGRGGNLRLGIVTGGTAKWLKDADHITTRYRPGELVYEIRDSSFGPRAVVTVEVLAYADTEVDLSHALTIV